MPKDSFRAEGIRDYIEDVAIDVSGCPEKAREIVLSADILIDNIRELDVFVLRANASKPTYYVSERWFKPILLDVGGIFARTLKCPTVPGFLKMVFPFAIKRALVMRKLMRSGNFFYLADGVFAARDMARLCGLMNWDLHCLFSAPEVKYENKPLGRIIASPEATKSYCLDNVRMWGYFVLPGLHRDTMQEDAGGELRVLWVGRLLNWKCVNTIVYAVGGLPGVSLDIYGDGPCKKSLEKLVARYKNVFMHGSIGREEVRHVMRTHDIYVLSSNQYEGWGAVVNEALEEGMRVIGTLEAGASATILPRENLYKVGDWKGLRKLLTHPISKIEIEPWTAKTAAMELWRHILTVKQA